MRQRRGMNFMGNSYMAWKKKGKGFFSRSAEGTGAREQVEGGALAVSSGAEGSSFHLPPFAWPLLLSLGRAVFGLLFSTYSGRSAVW